MTNGISNTITIAEKFPLLLQTTFVYKMWCIHLCENMLQAMECRAVSSPATERNVCICVKKRQCMIWFLVLNLRMELMNVDNCALQSNIR